MIVFLLQLLGNSIDVLEVIIVLKVKLKERYVVSQQITDFLVWTHSILESLVQLLQEFPIELSQLDNVRLQNFTLLVVDNLLF